MNSDRPIQSFRDDALERTDFSRMIGDILIKLPLGDSLCIGVMGAWGSGKTSIINMVCEYVNEKERDPRISIIRFSPWNFSTTEQVISQFFMQLAELFELDQSKNEKIGAAIKKYAGGLESAAISALLPLASPVMACIFPGLTKGGIEALGKAIEGTAFKNKSIQKQKDELEDLLKDLKEKIVIVIDDIDRLTDDQIRCIFQLVTVVCKFPNISYLLAFDRTIVSKALDQVQEERGDEFLDKVIQVPLNVPGLNKNKLLSIMASQIEALIKQYDIRDIDADKWNYLYGFCVSRLMNTPRDILRLCNSLKSKLQLVSEDVNFEDLLALSVMEQHEPLLYEWIKRHGEMLTGQLSYESLHDYGESDQDNRHRKERYLKEISQILHHSNRFTPEFAMETLCTLFPVFSSKTGGHYSYYDLQELRKNNNIGHPLKFNRYFSLNIDNGQITEAELGFILNKANENEIAEIIKAKDDSETSIELFHEIRARIKTLSAERTKAIIYCLQSIGDSLKSKSSDGVFTRIASSEAMYLINDLMRHLDEDERYQVLEEMISSMNESNINVTSFIMNRVYLAHNKIMDDEKKNPNDIYPSLKSDDELNKAEEQYRQRMKEIRDDLNAYKMINDGVFIHFYRRFPEGKEYLTRVISADPGRIIYYFFTRTTQWHITGSKRVEDIEITGKYKDLVTDEQVRDAIHNYVNTGKIWDLDIAQQRTAIAYIMKEEDSDAFGKGVSVRDIDKRRNEMLNSANENTKQGNATESAL